MEPKRFAKAFDPAHTFFPTCSDFRLDFALVVRMACERKFLESEATTGFFLLLGQQGNKAVLDWVMKEGLIPSRYECPKCKKDMRLVERKGTIDGFEWCCRVQSKENPHFVCRSVRKGTWFSDSLSICVILRLTRLDFALVVRMACERKFLESEATTGFFLLLGQQGNKAVLDWVMKEGLIPSRYECPKCKKDMRLVERKGTIDGFEWCCRVQSKENPHFVCRSFPIWQPFRIVQSGGQNMVTLKPVNQKNRVKSRHRSLSSLTLLQHVEFDLAHTFFPTCSDFRLDFALVVRMACERKFLESEATTGFFLLLGQQGNKAVLDWVMKKGLIPSRYECPKCKKDMRLVERKGTIDGFEWCCRVRSKENPHFVCRSVRKGTWFSDSLSICVILRLTRLDFALVVRMACERKFLESEATTGFFLLLGQQGNKAVLDWVMKEGLIPSRYECPKCKKDMRLVERKGTIDGFEWCCRVQSKENPHFVCRSLNIVPIFWAICEYQTKKNDQSFEASQSSSQDLTFS
ncbi:uncharacterized protein TNCV_813021 [Trichonephila clavipes]|nr:uncharacterized protein TNCV_813021 [Trichonephila clavipes]